MLRPDKEQIVLVEYGLLHTNVAGTIVGWNGAGPCNSHWRNPGLYAFPAPCSLSIGEIGTGLDQRRERVQSKVEYPRCADYVPFKLLTAVLQLNFFSAPELGTSRRI